MANKGWFDPQLASDTEWFDPQLVNLGWFDEQLTDSSFGGTQAGFKSWPVGGLRRMGATSGGGGGSGTRPQFLPLLGVA